MSDLRPTEGIAADWPRDPANGYLLCTPAKPRPAGASGQWAHTGTTSDGECSEGCCDYYRCKDCGTRWKQEVAQ